MPEFASPAWLGLLPPLLLSLWWLHRFGISGIQRLVPALYLWRDCETPLRGDRRERRSDPLWLLRGAIVSLLLLALAKPQITDEPKTELTLWIDNSLSMVADESGTPRWQTAVVAISQALREASIEQVTLRPLFGHSAPRRITSTDKGTLTDVIGPWMTAPVSAGPLPLLPLSSGQHWLVSDGADIELPHWLEGANINRIIAVGNNADNVALTYFGLRPAIDVADGFRGNVRVQNLGISPASGLLRITAAGEPFVALPWSLQGGDRLDHAFSISNPLPAQLEATVTIAAGKDGLAGDNRLAMNPAATFRPRRVTLDHRCPAVVATALNALPRLELVAIGRAELQIRCTQDPFDHPLPLLRVMPADALPTQTQAINKAGAITQIDFAFDLSDPSPTRLEVLPLQLAEHIGTLLQTEILDPILVVENPAQASRIQPAAMSSADTRPLQASSDAEQHQQTLSPWLLAVAGLLLLLDLLLQLRPAYRLSRSIPIGPET